MISMRTTHFVPGAIIAAAIAALAGLAACQEQPSAKAGGKGGKNLETVKVHLVTAKPASVRPVIRVTGTLYGFEEVVVSAKVPGRVVAVLHDLGDRLAPSTPLVEIDRTDYDLAARERALAVSATLAKLGLGKFPEKEFNAQEVPTVRRTALTVANVRAKHDRLKLLFDEKPPLISEQEYADALTVLEVAQSEFNVELLNARALLAEANTLQAEWSVANQKLLDTTVRTPRVPTDGTDQPIVNPANPQVKYAVSERLVAVGDYVREGTPLYRLIDDDPVKLRAMVPERYAGQVGKDATVKVGVQAHETDFIGTVHRVSPQVDPANRTFTVEVLIANPDGKLKPGAFASAAIELPTERPVVSVPHSAVTSFAGVAKVFIIKDGKAVERRVEVGEKQGENTVINTGLAAGDEVVMSPPSQMVTGTPVVLAEPRGAAE